MLRVAQWAFWAFAKVVLSMRYRVRVHGLDRVRGLPRPLLFTPNHPGYVEPMIVLMTFWPEFKLRPLLFEGMFNNPVFRVILRILNAHRVPELEQASTEARQQTEQAIAGVIDSLKAGENNVVWPSGHVFRDGTERIGAARSLAEILRAMPEAQVVLVRTRGVWGSSFSYAYTGEAP